MAWYALFVMTGYEHKIANIISQFWRIDGLKSFVPVYGAHFRKAGKVFSEKKICFPGYVFLESETRGLEFYLSVKSNIYHTEHALRLLRYSASYLDLSFEMNEDDYSFLRKLLNDEHCIEMSQGCIKGTNIMVTDGPLRGLEGMIKRVNRHKMEATIETSFMGSSREITVGFEIVKKLS